MKRIVFFSVLFGLFGIGSAQPTAANNPAQATANANNAPASQPAANNAQTSTQNQQLPPAARKSLQKLLDTEYLVLHDHAYLTFIGAKSVQNGVADSTCQTAIQNIGQLRALMTKATLNTAQGTLVNGMTIAPAQAPVTFGAQQQCTAIANAISVSPTGGAQTQLHIPYLQNDMIYVTQNTPAEQSNTQYTQVKATKSGFTDAQCQSLAQAGLPIQMITTGMVSILIPGQPSFVGNNNGAIKIPAPGMLKKSNAIGVVFFGPNRQCQATALFNVDKNVAIPPQKVGTIRTYKYQKPSNPPGF